MGKAARANRARRLAAGPLITLQPIDAPDFDAHLRANAAQFPLHVVEKGSAAGQHLVLCGAGPSLAETAERCVDGDQVWACNGALPWLLERGHRVTHGFTINHTAGMVDVWSGPPDVDYLVATTAHPTLVKHLEGRRITWFHNMVGQSQHDVEARDRLALSLFPPTMSAGAGLNAVTRALDVAHVMGFERITVLGADCAIRGEQMHVDGGSAGWTDVTLSGPIDGRTWTGTADLWISANWLVRQARASGGRIQLVGDTLPVALQDKPDEFLDRLPHTVDGKGRRIPIEV